MNHADLSLICCKLVSIATLLTNCANRANIVSGGEKYASIHPDALNAWAEDIRKNASELISTMSGSTVTTKEER